MANILSQAGIETTNTVEAWHVTQSIDAFTGVEAYDIIVSGSVDITGSLNNGLSNTASGEYSHAEGTSTTASGSFSHAEGRGTIATGAASHAEGRDTVASGSNSHAEGYGTTATGEYSHAEGTTTIASGLASHAEGFAATASGHYSHAEGLNTVASGSNSHAEGAGTTAKGSYSHAEGSGTTASEQYSHAEGNSTVATGNSSHAEGLSTIASGSYSHAEGSNTRASGQASHAEGVFTIATGDYSHAEGLLTVASGAYQHVQGQYNISSSAQSAFIVGNGTSDATRSNLIFASGSQVQITGSLRVLGSITGSLLGTATTASYVNLVAGPNITINQAGTSFEISSSAYKVITSTDPGTALTSTNGTTQTIIKSIFIPSNTFTIGDIARFLIFIQYGINTTATEIRAYINSTSTIGGSMILGSTSSDYINLSSGVDGGGGFTRNLHISSSTITSWPSFTADTWKTDEGGDGFWSDSTGWSTGNIDWTTNKYLVITGKFTSSPTLGDTFNVRAAKITN